MTELELEQKERELKELMYIAVEKWQETFGFGMFLGFLLGIAFSIVMWTICN